MLLTGLVLLVLSLVILVAIVAWAAGLRWGLKLVKAPVFTWRRVLLVSFLGQLIGTLLGFAVSITSGGQLHSKLALMTVAVFVSWLCTLAIIARAFRLSSLKSVGAWLPAFATGIVINMLLVFVFVPFGIEAFVLSGNSLAPILRGPHHVMTCPQCGGPAIALLSDRRFPGARDPVDAICLKFHVATNLPAPDTTPLPADHVLSVKFLRPGRWEVATFRFPEDPRQMFVFRVVGLPGETVFIADDAVWVNGEKLTPPPELAGITYVDKMGWERIRTTRESPAKLGPDEYFVLGDFSINANDSRIWTRGAPGHPPFAVPADHITGRVTHIYWPPGRWRTL